MSPADTLIYSHVFKAAINKGGADSGAVRANRRLRRSPIQAEHSTQKGDFSSPGVGQVQFQSQKTSVRGFR